MYNNSPQQESSRSYVITLWLCLLFGVLGAHRFYTGHVLTGVIQCLTGGGLGIWTFIDLVMLSLNQFNDKEGLELNDFNPGCAIIILILSVVFALLVLLNLLIVH